MTSGELNNKQKTFCEHIVYDGMSQVEAYNWAYGERKSAKSNASRLMTNPKVKRYIQHLRTRLQNSSEANQRRTIAEFAKVAYSDIRNYISVEKDRKGETCFRVKPSKDWENSGAVREISHEKGKITVKLHDKVRSLENIARIAGLYTDLNQAMQSFTNYGYKIVPFRDGYIVMDMFEGGKDPQDIVELLERDRYELVPNEEDGTYSVIKDYDEDDEDDEESRPTV